MNDRKFVFVLVAVIVILLGLNVFLYDERVTGDAFRSVKKMTTSMRIAPEKVVVEEPAREKAPRQIIATKIKKSTCPNNGCVWAETGMIFYISTGAVNYFGYHPSKEGSYELFSKNDLGKFKDDQPYHDSESACVPGGTQKDLSEATPLCVTKYKGKSIQALNGLLCIEGRWWVAPKICPLPVSDEPSEVPDL